MVGIAITRFGGMIPRLGDQVVPEGMASFAEDSLLLSGELRGIRNWAQFADLRTDAESRGIAEIQRIYRMLNGSVSEWVIFDDETVDMVKGPLVNDVHRRFYYTSENHAPMMNTLGRYLNGDPGYLLGVPAPVAAPTVTPGNNTGEEVTRAYVYTYVTEFGEESAPSPATVATGLQFDGWVIDMEASTHDPAERALAWRNIYRTVTTLNGAVEYHRVNDPETIPIGTTQYIDNKTTNEVAVQNTIESEFFSMPPENLIGLVAHPNGFLMGFDGRDLYCSEPYRPHAWPQKYILATEDDIKGIGVYGTSAAICTWGHPYVATGVHPSALTFTKAQTANPCISSRRGIVPMPFGVYYPSDTGLMLVSSSGFNNATAPLITKSEWVRDYTPRTIDAVRWQSQYVAFHQPDQGFMFAPDERQAAFVELGKSWPHTVMQNDIISGDVFMVHQNVVYEWNPATGVPQTYTWRSREYVTPKPVNFGALVLEFGSPREISEETIEDYQEYNDQRFLYPLNPMNFHTLSRVKLVQDLPWLYVPPPPILPQIKQPFHASPLYNTASGNTEPVAVMQEFGVARSDFVDYKGELRVNVYADGVPLFENGLVIEDEEQYKLPTGYKARRWVIELIGSVDVASFKIAETGKELGEA